MAFIAILVGLALSIGHTRAINQATACDRMVALPGPIAKVGCARDAVVGAGGSLGLGAPAAGTTVGVAPLALVGWVLSSLFDDGITDNAFPDRNVNAVSSTTAYVCRPRNPVVGAWFTLCHR